MSEQGYEYAGKSTEEAIEEGLNHLNLRQDQVEIEIISKGSRGIFGIGSEPAHVRITPLSEPAAASDPSPNEPVATESIEQAQQASTSSQDSADDDSEAEIEPQAPAQSDTSVAAPVVTGSEEESPTSPADSQSSERDPGVAISDDEMAEMAAEILSEMIELMGFKAQVVSSWHDPDDGDGPPSLVLDIRGEDVSPLIGRQGETLASIQYLIRLMVNQRIRQWKNIVVDVEQYKERRVNQLTQLAHRMADQVAESGRAISLEPMPANERRIVHIALRDHTEVYTQSSGEDDRRKVHIVARNDSDE